MDAFLQEAAHDFIFPVVIFTVMFGLGLALNLEMIKVVLKKPRALIIGLSGQLIFLPLVGFALALGGPWSNMVALGLVVIAVCPGGSTSNAIVFAIRGDIALSVSLTALSSALTLFTIPFLLTLALGFWQLDTGAVVLPTGEILKNLLLLTALPVALGMLTRHYITPLAKILIEPLRKLALALLLFIIVLSIYNTRDYISAEINQIAVASLILVLLVIGGSLALGKIAKLELSQKLVIAIEVGVQNTALAIYLGASLLNMPELTVVAICYGLIDYAAIAVLVLLVRRSHRIKTRA